MEEKIWIGVISLFPEMFRVISEHGVIGRAIKNGILSIQCWNPRNFTYDKHRTVDARPYGGGRGMLLMAKPLKDAIFKAKSEIGKDAKVIYLSPQGRKLNQKGIYQLRKNKKLILVCGRYEGVDERIIESEVHEEWSIGDYVLSGGELPAMVMIDSMSRFIPGVLSHQESLEEESFMNGLLDYPHYTRPEILGSMAVPKVLLSGNHAKIERWRRKQSLGRTWLRRPELLVNSILTDEQKILLEEFQDEYKNRNQLD